MSKNLVWGHKRQTVQIGERQGPWQNAKSLGGYDLSCKCGWEGGHFTRSIDAIHAYSAHLKDVLDKPFQCIVCRYTFMLGEMRSDYRSMCKSCFSKKGNEWQQKNKEKSDIHKRNHSLMKFYGISHEEFEQILAFQGGVCAICKLAISDPRGYRPHVDHDHATKNVRGVLCNLCNVGLGGFRDNIDNLKSAIAYLEEAGDVHVLKRMEHENPVTTSAAC